MRGDRLSGLFLFVLALYVVYEARKLPFGTLHAPDSGFFPVLLGSALVLVSGVIWLTTFSKADETAPVPSFEGTPRVVVAILALVLYVAVLERLGYLASTFGVMILLLRGVERVRWRTALAIVMVAVPGSYAVFRWLGVPLPQGILLL